MTTIRPIRIDGDVAYLALTKGYEAVIDAEDAVSLQGTTWTAQEHRRKDGTLRTVYAVRKVGGRKGQIVLLHRVLTHASRDIEVDHRDGDGLNCRQGNMREATRSQNAMNLRIAVDNTSGFKGVWWHKQRSKWCAQIKADGVKHNLGLFRCRTAAAIAYAKASAQFHGDFGRIA